MLAQADNAPNLLNLCRIYPEPSTYSTKIGVVCACPQNTQNSSAASLTQQVVVSAPGVPDFDLIAGS